MPETPQVLATKPVIWTVSLTRLEELFRDVAPEYDQRATIHNLHGGYEDAVSLLKKRLARQPCDVIIAAGSNGSYIRKHIDKPVVLVEPSGFDLMQALNRARRLSDRIAVVTHQYDLPTFAEFCDAFGLAIEQRSFQTAEDARSCVAELIRQKVGAIVGTGLVTDLADDAGLPGILLYSPDSVRRALNAALDLVAAVERSHPADRTLNRGKAARPVRYRLDDIRGESAVMRAVRDQAVLCAASDATLFIHGETGTGKELVAQAVHAASGRRQQPFVPINCGAIAESLLESELFGHEEGAFTGARRGGRPGLIEAAHKGTLFLDEIGEMPLALQTRLLRVLEEREVLRVGSNQPVAVDLRVIAASHCHLDQLVKEGRFRADLYYRLNVLRINLPRLARRLEDIPQLVQGFATLLKNDTRISLDDEAVRLLSRYDWPGNLRELKNLVERLLVVSRNRNVQVDAIMLRRCAPEMFSSRSAAQTPAVIDEKAMVEAALRDAMGNRADAARALGISRSTLWRRMQAHGLLT